MRKESKDRRVKRTRRRLQEALLDLILEKGYDRVTVQDILDRADVGRSTFYSHFLNKADLLMGDMRSDVFTLTTVSSPVEIPSVAWMFEHAAEHRALYQALVGSEAMPHVYHHLREGLQRNWEELITKMKDEGVSIQVPVDATAAYLTNALIGLLSWWMDNRMPYAPAEMDRTFRRLAERGLLG